MCNNIFMARKYELKRRAERQDLTRQRIVDATIALHTTIGPARTTISAIAEHAGVQRHTVYSHFPDERALGFACSGCYNERYPLPDATSWQTIADPERRLRHGLTELYAYFAQRGDELAPILRDLDTDALTRELVDRHLGPALARIRAVLAEPFQLRGTRRTRLLAMLDLFLNLSTWRVLARTMSAQETVEAAVRAICSASDRQRSTTATAR